MFDDDGKTATAKIKDKKVLVYFEKLENLPQEDKDVIFAVIDSMVIKHEVSQISKKAGSKK